MRFFSHTPVKVFGSGLCDKGGLQSCTARLLVKGVDTVVSTEEVISLHKVTDTTEEFLPEQAGVTVDRVVCLCGTGSGRAASPGCLSSRLWCPSWTPLSVSRG